MIYRAYFKLRFTLLSPLSIGDSFSEKTDRDIIMDSLERPVVPATSIAGVLRSLATDEQKSELFGYIKDKEQQQSRLIFYDAVLQGDSSIATRDCVALDECKTAIPGKKFNFQAVESGAKFIGYAEARSERAKNALEALLAKAFTLGSKATRGYGKIKLDYQCKVFTPQQQADWLKFDMFSFAWPDEEEAWIKIASQASQGSVTWKLELKQQGGLSIRQYMTEEAGADYGPTALRDGIPVIPGTSWAGMFRRHMAAWLDDDELRCVFGYVDESSPKCKKSKISFSESAIKGGTPKLLTRNMIDRFTNGTKDGALYTELTIYGGTTTLEITLGEDVCTKAKRALCAAIFDLHNGYAAVGGLTAVGRGLFQVTKFNEESFDEKFETLLKEVGCCG